MKSGSPAFGTPYTQATIASGQLARKLPLRASNNASNAPEAISIRISDVSLGLSPRTSILFTWAIEGGLCASYEKVILDAEMSQIMEASRAGKGQSRG